MSNAPTQYRRFRGGWCDNCNTAYPFIPKDGNCPSCGPVKLLPATITVEVDEPRSILDSVTWKD